MDARNNDFDFDFTPIGLLVSLTMTQGIFKRLKMRGKSQVWSCSFSL